MLLPNMHTMYLSLQCLAGLALSAELRRPRAAQADIIPEPTNTLPPASEFTPITTPPPACDVVSSLSAACGERTPGFSSLSPFTSQASCLCYSSTAWAPNIYDQAYQSCSIASTAGGSPCKDAGNVAGAQVSITAGVDQLVIAPFTANYAVDGTEGPPNTTINSGDDPNRIACTRYTEIHSSCDAATPSFHDLPFLERARCLCYEGPNWNPNIYDGAAGPCIAWYSTAAPAQFSAMLSALQGSVTSSPCHHFSTRGSPPTVFALPSPTATVPASTPAGPTNTFGELSTIIQSDITAAAAASTSKGAAILLNVEYSHLVSLPLFAWLLSL